MYHLGLKTHFFLKKLNRALEPRTGLELAPEGQSQIFFFILKNEGNNKYFFKISKRFGVFTLGKLWFRASQRTAKSREPIGEILLYQKINKGSF